MAGEIPFIQMIKDLEAYFKQGHDMKDFVFDTLIDHCSSQALLWGMWGNVMMANFYNQLAALLKDLKDKAKKQ